MPSKLLLMASKETHTYQNHSKLKFFMPIHIASVLRNFSTM
jgi:hypothetical protein